MCCLGLIGNSDFFFETSLCYTYHRPAIPDPLANALATANEHQPIISFRAPLLIVKVPIGVDIRFVDERMAASTGKAVNDMLDAVNRMNAALSGGVNPSRLLILYK
jgi:hypothetical protein